MKRLSNITMSSIHEEEWKSLLLSRFNFIQNKAVLISGQPLNGYSIGIGIARILLRLDHQNGGLTGGELGTDEQVCAFWDRNRAEGHAGDDGA